MAIPPQPIEEVLPKAVLIIDGEVKEVVSTGPAPKKVEARAGASDTGQKTAAQVVKLEVKRVLKGKTDAKEIVVEKPEAGYALRAGNKGPFLLDATRPNPVILGRYGPDSYAFSRIEAALKK